VVALLVVALAMGTVSGRIAGEHSFYHDTSCPESGSCWTPRTTFHWGEALLVAAVASLFVLSILLLLERASRRTRGRAASSR
jgi:hypothetical protein